MESGHAQCNVALNALLRQEPVDHCVRHARRIGNGMFAALERFECHSASEFGMVYSHRTDITLPEEQRLAKSCCQIIEEARGNVDITRDHSCARILQRNG